MPGHEFILRSELSSVLKQLRNGAEMNPQEWQAYHTFFNADTTGGERRQFTLDKYLPRLLCSAHIKI